ncbi:hypothetical protein ACOME3_001995 [Neoechinorhynchus agilis]
MDFIFQLKRSQQLQNQLLEMRILSKLMDVLDDHYSTSKLQTYVIDAIEIIAHTKQGLKMVFSRIPDNRRSVYDRLLSLVTQKRLRLSASSIDRILKRMGFFIDLVLFNQTLSKSGVIMNSFLVVLKVPEDSETLEFTVELASHFDLVGVTYRRHANRVELIDFLKKLLSMDNLSLVIDRLFAGKTWLRDLFNDLKKQKEVSTNVYTRL